MRIEARRRLGGIGLATLLLAVAAGCGSSDDDQTDVTSPPDGGRTTPTDPPATEAPPSGSAAQPTAPSTGNGAADWLAEAKATAAAFSDAGNEVFDYSAYIPTEAVEPRDGARLAIVAGSLAVPAISELADGVADLAGTLGWEADEFDGQFAVTTQSQLIQQAVELGYDGIVLVAVSPASVPAPVAAAKERGIPVISYSGFGDEPASGVTDVGFDPEIIGQAIGAWVVADSEGLAKVAVFTAPDGPTQSILINATQRAIIEQIERCETCEVLTEEVPISDFSEPGTPFYVAYLGNHPAGSLTHVAGGYDSSMIALSRANVEVGRVEIAAIGGAAGVSAQGLEQITSGAAAVAPLTPNGFIDHLVIDTMIRRINGQEVDNVSIPIPIVTADTAAQFAGDPPSFEPGVDYETAFAELWGTGS